MDISVSASLGKFFFELAKDIFLDESESCSRKGKTLQVVKDSLKMLFICEEVHFQMSRITLINTHHYLNHKASYQFLCSEVFVTSLHQALGHELAAWLKWWKLPFEMPDATVRSVRLTHTFVTTNHDQAG